MKPRTLGWEMSARCRLALLQTACQRRPQSPADLDTCVEKWKRKRESASHFFFSSNEIFFTWPLLTPKLIPASCPFTLRREHTGPGLSKPISRCCHGSALPAVGISLLAHRQIECAQTSRSFWEDCESQIQKEWKPDFWVWPVYSGSYADAKSDSV